MWEKQKRFPIRDTDVLFALAKSTSFCAATRMNVVDKRKLKEILGVTDTEIAGYMINVLGWKFESPYDDATIYIQTSEANRIYAGVLHKHFGEMSRVLLAVGNKVPSQQRSRPVYILSAAKYKNIMKELDNYSA